MPVSEIYARLNRVFREVFGERDIEITSATTAHDVPDWDSANHIVLIVAIEQEFGITLQPAELEAMKDVSEMVRLIESKT